MTEQEAKLRWCPFARVMMHDTADRPVAGCAGINRDPENNLPLAVRCIASDCMAWRWVKHQENPPEKKLGCCGLAGK